MSHTDAEAALSLYRQFCKQTGRVVEYLSVAKKLQNLLNVSIPNLKHVCPLIMRVGEPNLPLFPDTISILMLIDCLARRLFLW